MAAGILFFFLFVIAVAIWLIVVIWKWTKKLAIARGKDPIAWALLGFFFFPWAQLILCAFFDKVAENEQR
ncbi:MAG: hypothetical protein LBB27_03405 [Tannerellaceae bacterium]|jgi:hypothetical protein|nr:hypothetical protein [Tannerellaceae bacterium]